jgi:hypothetical protein
MVSSPYMILQLNPIISLETPKGHGYANFIIDSGEEGEIYWIVFLDNKEIWVFKNSEVRTSKNITLKRV